MTTSAFAGRVVAVTGAGSGISGEVARELLHAGARVLALDVNRKGLQTLAESAPDRVEAVVCDITDEAGVEAAYSTAVTRFGRLDGLVNGAGIVDSAPFLEFGRREWERAFTVNVWGSYVMIKHAVPHLRRAGGGSIVNFSSSGGKLANPFTAPYAASKAAIISLTRSAAGALAPDIRVNAVVPGIIDTPMWKQLDQEFEAINVPISLQSRSGTIPLGRPGRPDDVGAGVLFLLSDAARYITGEDLNISGGQVMH